MVRQHAPIRKRLAARWMGKPGTKVRPRDAGEKDEHLVVDGASMKVLLEDVTKAYRGEVLPTALSPIISSLICKSKGRAAAMAHNAPPGWNAPGGCPSRRTARAARLRRRRGRFFAPAAAAPSLDVTRARTSARTPARLPLILGVGPGGGRCVGAGCEPVGAQVCCEPCDSKKPETAC